MKKVVFLTGATGIMGMETVKRFMDHLDEIELRVLARPSEINYEKLKPYEDKIQIIWGNLMDYDLMSRCMEGVDYVLHVGAILNPIATDWPPDITLRTNYGSTLAMLRGIKQYHQEEKTRFVYVSTVEALGHHEAPHIWGRMGDPLQPPIYCYYAMSKVASERAVAESGLKYWAIVRQSFQIPNNPIAADYPIVAHMPQDTYGERMDAESSGNLMVQICLNAPENFWRYGYHMGGGEDQRFDQYSYVKALHGNARAGWSPKWLATKNYHGCYFTDSDDLNEIVPYRLKDRAQFLKDELMNQIKLVKSKPRMTPEEVEAKNKRIARKPGGTLWAIENNNEETIRVLWGSREKYDAIPENWEDIPLPEPTYPVEYLDHGYDETKPLSELDLADMQQAAKFRGGECLSETMEKGDLFTPLNWKCAFGHEFTGSPNLILRLGHWCPHCLEKEWNYYEQAKVNPFFAQTWDHAHKDEEPFTVKMECDATLIDKCFDK